MSPIRKKTSSLPTLQIVLAIAMLLVVLVVAVYMLAPQRPMAPPPSDLEYAERPKDRVELPPTAPPDMKPPEPLAPEAVTGEEPAPETPTAEDAGFSITGLVLDSRTGDPIQDALVAVRSKSGPVEAEPREDLGERRRRLGRMRERAQRSIARAHTDEQGHFTLALVEPGDFVVEARAPEYAIATVDIGAINSGRPTADIKVELSTGGRISGRVTEEGSSLPISGLIVMGSEGRYQATTDDNGEYVLAGLPIGEHDVAVDLGNTSFKSGKTLPFQKVQITDVDQEVRNIDFTLDPAGVVWGYVVTPENDAIKSAEVVLCNSESVLSQAISSMVRQAPPLTDRSETDGYYELVGVPLNEEWRVYATSKTYSPQLADPFLLTADQRSARVDI
ncbi:MAG: carboxypeptidase regulatory-like domain-containing protein, partial [Candidatus Hydrogenedentes bacterium]|nr:carboxypeptidase regulatory-like domain-containing protein [Candidatus Hydrogenedentota bacterium]